MKWEVGSGDLYPTIPNSHSRSLFLISRLPFPIPHSPLPFSIVSRYIRPLSMHNRCLSVDGGNIRMPMGFDLTEEQQQVKRSVREFAEAEIKPHVMEWDEAQ